MDAYENYLAHHGIKGQRWGVRRYQNEDGTLTPEGKARYLNPDGSLNALGKKELGSNYRRSTTGHTTGVNQYKNPVFNKSYDPDRMARAGIKLAGTSVIAGLAYAGARASKYKVTGLALMTGAGYMAVRNGQTFLHELYLRSKERG